MDEKDKMDFGFFQRSLRSLDLLSAEQDRFAKRILILNFPVGTQCHPVAAGIQPQSGDVLNFFSLNYEAWMNRMDKEV